MKNYRKSDYALNRYSKGIVYQFSDTVVEVSLADYLAENPDKTEQDFWELKKLSDVLYHMQVKSDNAQTKKNISLNSVQEKHSLEQVSLAEMSDEKEEIELAAQALNQLLKKGVLTETQKRRLILYIFEGHSLREIAKNEKVSHLSVRESIRLALDKVKKYFPDHT